jgi:hypothetical protein
MFTPDRFAGAVLLTAAALLGGCAHYEYDIIEPPELAGHIGSQTDIVLNRDPLIYRMRSYDNYLVIRIFNPTPDPISLRGDQSYIVDPQGMSHPPQSQTIGPRAFIKLILPPLPPEAPGMVPTTNVQIGAPSDFGPQVAEMVYLPPATHYANEGFFWNWNGEGDVRMSLAFQRDAQPPFTQNFGFRRRKV